MSWTKDDQTRLDRLRDKELAGTLTEPERAEIAVQMGAATGAGRGRA